MTVCHIVPGISHALLFFCGHATVTNDLRSSYCPGFKQYIPVQR